MASLWQRTLFYLGLVDEEEGAYEQRPDESVQVQAGRDYEQGLPPGPGERGPYQPTESPYGGARRVEPPMAARRRTLPEGALADAGVIVTPAETSAVRTVTEQDLETEIITARSYADAQKLADQLRASVPVIFNLRKVEPAMVRRLVDFASGLTYALGGTMRKVAQGVILVTPANVNITRDERRRLESLGYYDSGEMT
jgi:cell division inhibitor SepF